MKSVTGACPGDPGRPRAPRQVKIPERPEPGHAKRKNVYKKIQKRTYGDFDDVFFYKNWKKKHF